MKKITKYILILLVVILIGVFGLGLEVSADGVCMVDGKPTSDPAGSCPGIWSVTINGWCWKNGEKIDSIKSSSECTADGQVWQAVGSAIPPPPAGPTPPSYDTPPEGLYNFLAPLPCTGNTPGCDGKLQKTFNPTQENNLGAYLNMMIRVFIGICSVLAVIMIVIGGIEYMTSELPGNKEHGKHRILNAIFGLALALISWTLLNQINPDLLKADLTTLTQAVVDVEIMDETETFASALDGDSPFAPGIVTPLCPEGIIRTQSGAPACQRIAAQFDKMVADAKLQGIVISGYGYRNIANQKQLRIDHCNGDFENRNAPCDPPTALPGASNHNHGLAFDLRCTEGGGPSKKIATRDNKCFVWLSANAGKSEYGGLRNLPIEPWHWSVDGR